MWWILLLVALYLALGYYLFVRPNKVADTLAHQMVEFYSQHSKVIAASNTPYCQIFVTLMAKYVENTLVELLQPVDISNKFKHRSVFHNESNDALHKLLPYVAEEIGVEVPEWF